MNSIDFEDCLPLYHDALSIERVALIPERIPT